MRKIHPRQINESETDLQPDRPEENSHKLDGSCTNQRYMEIPWGGLCLALNVSMSTQKRNYTLNNPIYDIL